MQKVEETQMRDLAVEVFKILLMVIIWN